MQVGGVLPRVQAKPIHEAVSELESQDQEFMLSQSVPEKLRRAFYHPSI